jgi:DUF4097 and DUF4098 domain-containing protein YvlB
MHRIALGVAALLLTAGSLSAQTFTTGSCHDDEGNTNNNSWFGGRAKVCELRRTTLPLVNGQVNVRGKNGGIEVVGEDRRDIVLEARVIAQASGRDEAESILHKVSIGTQGTIEAKGPEMSGWSHANWSVNFRLHVPRHVSARLYTENGGIDVTNIEGKVEAQTTNGGLSLNRLAGDVHAETVNGGLDVTLEGTQWRGAGLVAKSTNGGVSVKAPDHYSAHLVAETVNGGIEVGFPITLQGKIRNHIDTNLGNGGPTLQFETVNGGVSVERD